MQTPKQLPQQVKQKTINSKTVQDILRVLTRYLEDTGRDELSVKSQRDFKVFHSKDYFQADLEHFNRIFKATEDQIDDPNLGLTLATSYNWHIDDFKPKNEAIFELNKHLTKNSFGLYPSVAACLIEHYNKISNHLFDISFVVNKKSCKLTLKRSTNTVSHQLVEAMMFGVHMYFCYLTRERLVGLGVFGNKENKNFNLYQDAYGVAPVFNEKERYELKYTLSGPPQSFNDVQPDWLARFETLYHQVLPHEGFVQRSRGMLRALLPIGMATREHLAAIYNLSVSSFHRKLKLEGYTFSQLILEERMCMAQHYINSSDLPLTQVAELLGYREISHFSKAFKQWFGVSPSNYQAA